MAEENTSKVFIAGDANLAAASLLNAHGTAALLAAGQGTSLFVINLCASMAPLVNVGKTLPGLETYRLYQVARREDGRTRYRLRLGFFTSEADAESVLNGVRDAYPTAFTACLCDEDQKFARGFLPETSAPAPRPVAAAPKIAVVETRPASPPVAIKPAAPVKAAATAKPPSTDTVTVRALTPAAKPAAPVPVAEVESKPAPAAAKTSTSDTAIQKRIALPAATVAKQQAAKPTPVAASTPPPIDEIELSWDLPALEPAANAAPIQVMAPSFKTQDVIKAPAPPAAPSAAKPPVKQVETPKAAPKPEPKAAPKTTIEAPSKLLASIELTLESDAAPAPKAAAPQTVSTEPFRVGKGVEIPASSLSLQSEAAVASPSPVAKGAATPSKPAPTVPQAKPIADLSKMKVAHAAAPAAIKAAVAPPIRKVDGPAPDLDSTQTIRALTNDELADDSQEKWFAIQLAVSEQPVNLDTMPRLDIFEAYRLYSVASAGSGKITHSLRIGFFREDHSAEAVSGYLKTFFNSPTVVRISIAEQARFKDAPAPKPIAKSEGKEGKVLDLSHARDRTPKAVPTVTMAVETKKFDPMATGSFKANATGSHKSLATGAHNALNATAAHKALNATGTHKGLSATGTHKALSTGAHKALKPAAKSAAPATKRSQPLSKASATGKHQALQVKKSLSEQLLDEAREVELSKSGIRKLPKDSSLFAKMFGKKK